LANKDFRCFVLVFRIGAGTVYIFMCYTSFSLDRFMNLCINSQRIIPMLSS